MQCYTSRERHEAPDTVERETVCWTAGTKCQVENTSKTAMPLLYECRGNLEIQLKDVQYFATTTDLWPSSTSEPYTSLTNHYIDEEWALQSRCLQTAYFLDDHTAEIIGRAVTQCLNWPAVLRSRLHIAIRNVFRCFKVGVWV